MKKSEFIKKVLKSKTNTVFTTKEQVENAIEIFQTFGMFPPEAEIKGYIDGEGFFVPDLTGVDSCFVMRWEEE